MSRKHELDQIRKDLSLILDLVDKVTPLLSGIAEMCRLSINLDRLGPRLDLIDRIGPRLEIIDQLGPRLELLDALGTLIEPLKSLAMRAAVLDQFGEVLTKFNDDNHLVSESVRVDVETISALAAQVELFNRQLLSQLSRAIERD